MNSKSVVIVTTKRTPLGSFQGQFTSSSASDLGSLSIDTAIKSSGVKLESVESVHFGCVLPARQGQVPVLQPSLKGGSLFQRLAIP